MSAPLRREWRIAEADRARAAALSDALDLPPLIAQLLVARGVATPGAARDFLAPGLRHLADPHLLTDMDRAVARIHQARERGEHVRVFGDYDVDGIAATAVMTRALRRFGVAEVSFGVPSRFEDGYGLGPAQVDQARAEGVRLLITVDNGISAHAAADRARAVGVDLLVTDHHSIESGLPDALAVINPRREAPDHPLAHLCGAGVALKLGTALNGAPNDLDIAALGTVADLVPLRGENRTIVSLGLRHMAKHARTGIVELAAAAELRNGAITAENIAFQLGPRINAAGRVHDGLPALRLLLTDDAAEARALARQLSEANEARRALERAIFDEAVEELEATLTPERRGIVLARRGWHPGVIGIVAARVEGRFHRPVVVIAVDDQGEGKGSARAGEGFDMVGAFAATREHLIRYGGHRAAAGMSIREERIPAFREAFEAEARRQLGAGAPPRTLDIDALAALSQIDYALLDGIARLEPCGNDNPAPLFCSMGVTVVPRSVQVLRDAHLRFLVRQADTVLPVIGFNMAERHYTEGIGETIDIAYAAQRNTYQGETKIQLQLRDFRPA